MSWKYFRSLLRQDKKVGFMNPSPYIIPSGVFDESGKKERTVTFFPYIS
jgi:hypothetical protein